MNYKACRISPCEPHKIIIHPNELKRKVYIETTSECNNNCRHCFNRSGDSSTRIPFPELVAMEELFTRSNNIIQVILSGGEFFTRPDYLEIVKLFSHKHDVQILTNGKILPKAMIDYLILHKNAELQITLAGDCSKIDALLRGECFEDTINNIKIRRIFEFMEKKIDLCYCVYMLWHDALPVMMTEELAKNYLDHGIRMAKDSNTIYVNADADDLAQELGQISANDFVLQWNWLNDHQPESYSEGSRLFQSN